MDVPALVSVLVRILGILIEYFLAQPSPEAARAAANLTHLRDNHLHQAHPTA